MIDQKKYLVTIANKISDQHAVTPKEVKTLLAFVVKEKENTPISHLKNWAVPLSLLFGFSLATFAATLDPLIEQLPLWTNMSPSLLNGVDYLWSILSNPIEKPNIIYHLPNLVLYSFGIVGIKHIIDRIDRHTWLDKVLAAQSHLREQVAKGQTHWKLLNGHSLLFVGAGDYIAQQFVFAHSESSAVTIGDRKQQHTQVWSKYDFNGVYDDLRNVLDRSGGRNAGEYIFFPVRDMQIFLPGPTDFDVSPHKLDIFCKNIRLIEQELNWQTKPIIIVGDKYHCSFVQSEHRTKIVPKSQETISLLSISRKYAGVRLLDPTDIVLKKIVAIAAGREIVFRATKEGIKEYKRRFYKRLRSVGYKATNKKILTIGYDIFEDQTEQQTLTRTVQNYYPVVLSKNVADALLRNGYKREEFLYVPDLVLSELKSEAARQ